MCVCVYIYYKEGIYTFEFGIDQDLEQQGYVSSVSGTSNDTALLVSLKFKCPLIGHGQVTKKVLGK